MKKDIKSLIGANIGNKATQLKTTKTCYYEICDGSGIIPNENKTSATFCKCYEREMMERKLENSNINKARYIDLGFEDLDDKTTAVLLKPKSEITPFVKSARIKTELDESVNNFMKRNYGKKSLGKRPLKEILQSYINKNEELMNNGEKATNLMLMGEPGNGKTTLATLVGKEFLLKNKKVYFSTVQDFIDAIFSKEIDPKKIAREVDVLILDELLNEYHTDSSYAKKQLKEIFKSREELGKITICTSNGNPKDFKLLYGESMMSLINGTFFLFHLERNTDLRVEEMHDRYKEFDL